MSAASWTCPTCGRAVSTPYCPACGEHPLRARDLTFRGILEQLFHAFSNVDGRVLRSLRTLVNHPGMLTVAYLRGQRMPYIGPIQLFLIANVFFFAAQSATNMNIVGATLDSHLHLQDWGPVAQRLVEQRLATLQTNLESFAPAFNQAIVLNAKSLIVLMVPPFALLLPAVFYRDRRPFVAHMTFSLHFYAFLLLLLCAGLAIASVDLLCGGDGLNSPRMDTALSILLFSACAIYLYIATGRVYGAHGAARAFKTLALTVAAAVILLGYRFTMFVITLYAV